MKNYQDKIRKVIFSVLFVLVLFGCVSKQKTAPAILIKHPERMFWEIQRGDASIFVLGTIHVADDKFFPLEEQVLKAFDSADVLVSEVGKLNVEELTAKMQAKMLKSLNFLDFYRLKKLTSLIENWANKESRFLCSTRGF